MAPHHHNPFSALTNHSVLTATWNDMDALESLAAMSFRNNSLVNALLTNRKSTDPTSSTHLKNTTHTRHNLGHYIYSYALLEQESPLYHTKVIKAVNNNTDEIEACAWLQYIPAPFLPSESTAPSTSSPSASSAASAVTGTNTDTARSTSTTKTPTNAQGQGLGKYNDLPDYINATEWLKQENFKTRHITHMLKTYKLDSSREGYYCGSPYPAPPIIPI